jgi:phosphoribosylpyrophosphate synthetase
LKDYYNIEPDEDVYENEYDSGINYLHGKEKLLSYSNNETGLNFEVNVREHDIKIIARGKHKFKKITYKRKTNLGINHVKEMIEQMNAEIKYLGSL